MTLPTDPATAALSAVLDSTHYAIVHCNVDGIIQFFNAGAERMLGYRADELVGVCRPDLFHDPAEVVERAEALTIELGRPVAPGAEVFLAKIHHGGSDSQEWTYIRKDGSRFPVILSLTAVSGPDDTVQGYLGIAVDISERKRAEAKAAAIRSALVRAQTIAHIGSFESDTKARKLVYWSPELTRIMGLEPDQTPTSWESFVERYVHPDDRVKTFKERQESRQARRSFNLEFRIVRPSGEVRHVHAIGDREFDADGAMIRMTGTLLDITDRKQMEDVVLRQREFLRSALDHLPVAVYVKDARPDSFGRYQLWNKASEQLLGMKAEEVLGKTVFDLFPNHLATKFETTDRNALDGRTAVHLRDIEVPSRTLGPRRIHSMKVPLFDAEGRPNLILGALEDITERTRANLAIERHTRELEISKSALERTAHDLARSMEELADANVKAEAATRAKSEFLAMMSHEIRTPMNGVIGMTGLLLETKLTPEQQEFAQTIRHSGTALLTIINDILDFSKIEAGKLTVEQLPLDLHQVLAEVGDLLAVRANEKGLDLVLRYAPAAERHFIGDPGRLRQVLMNLAGNAIKFTEQGHVLIEVDQQRQIGDEVSLRIAVTDTGIGIPPDKQAHLFQKFIQADASTTRHFGGTGLGLAISKQLVELMGGTIGVTSAPRAGSTFWISLTFRLDPDAGPPADGSALAGVRALVVAPVGAFRSAIVEQLTGWSMPVSTVETAGDALVALRAANGSPFRVAIVAVDAIDGDALTRAIAQDPALAGLRVAAVARASRTGDPARFRAAGYAAYLVRPLVPDELRDTLAEMIQPGASFITRRSGVPAPAAPAPLPTLGVAGAGQPRILLVEDNLVNQKVATKMLQRFGCQVDLAGNGREAVDKYDLLPYDLVLMDCQMPVMDGFQATGEIRRREDASGRRTPIVALTANAIQGDRDACLASGMDDYLSKPIDPASLRVMLTAWIGARA